MRNFHGVNYEKHIILNSGLSGSRVMSGTEQKNSSVYN
jgi:hypothetical protein